jgi:RHS repeat-associated protein
MFASSHAYPKEYAMTKGATFPGRGSLWRGSLLWLPCCLFAYLVVVAAQPLRAADDKRPSGGTVTAGNAIYNVHVEDTPGLGVGLYTFTTGPAHPAGSDLNVLYGDGSPGTTFNTIRSYTSGTDYVQDTLDKASVNTVIFLDPFGIVTLLGTTGFRTTYVLPGPPETPDALTIVSDVHVNGTTFEDSTIQVTTTIINNGATPVDVGIRYLWDFQIGEDDGPTFQEINPNGAVRVHEAEFSAPRFVQYRVEDNDENPSPPTLFIFGTATGPATVTPTPPDLLQYACWPDAFDTAFEYVVDPRRDIATTASASDCRGFAGGDVAVHYFFGPDEASAITIPPGGMHVVSASLFLTAPSPTPTPALIATLHRSSPSSRYAVRGGADPVDLATGSYMLQNQDIAVPARGLPSEFTRTYHSAAAGVEGPLGFGWMHSYNMFVFLDPEGALVVRMPDGRLDKYVDNGTGMFEPPPGIYNHLALNPDGTFTLTTKQRDTYEFDASGRLMTLSDRNGNTTLLGYTGTLLTSVAAPDGRLLVFDYDAEDRISAATDPLGRTTSYAYDANGDLVSVTDPLGGLTTFAYDAEHRITSITDPRGNKIINNTYDDEGRVIQQVDAAGGVTTLAYTAGETVETDPLGRIRRYGFDSELRISSVVDPLGGTVAYGYDASSNLTSFTDELGNVTRFFYDARGNVITVIDPLGHSQDFAYDVADNQVRAIESMGNTTRFVYDAAGNLTRVIDPLGGVTNFVYDSFGQVVSVTDANGHQRSFSYDSQGNVSAIVDPLGNTTTLTYNAVGRLLRVTDPLGGTTVYTYDALNRLITVEDALGHVRRYAYDANHNLSSETDARGIVTSYTYDALNRLIRMVDGQGGTMAYGYDAVGNRTSLTDANGRVTNPLGHATAYTYDALSRLVTVEDALGHAHHYAYDANHNLISETDAEGVVTSYTYDALNRLARAVDGQGGVLAYTYDAVGNRISHTDANGHVTQYTYSARDQLTQVNDPLGRITGYAHDLAGNLVSRTDAHGHITLYTYDALNRLAHIAHADETSVEYTYDAVGNVTSMVDSTGTTLFQYDMLSRLVGVTDPRWRQIRYAYDPADNRLSVIYPDGSMVRYAYDANNRLSSVTDWLGNTTAYTYDAAGRLVETRHANGIIVTNTLDAADRLLAVTNMRVADAKVLASTRYELDAVGNRLSMTSEPTGNRVRPSRDVIIDYTYDAADQLVTAGGLPFTFDANGNQINCGDDVFVYDEENRLVRAEVGLGEQSCRQLAEALGLSSGSGSVSTYQYNGTGLRIAQSIDSHTTTYVWDLGAVLPVVIDDGENRYVYGLNLIAAVDQQNQVRTYLYDGIESVVTVTDGNDNATTSLTYDAFGTKVGGAAAPGKFGFTGEQTDVPTGFIYLRARHYDPTTGRFLTTDPTGVGEPTLYTYAQNNPLFYVDPYGDVSLAGIKSKIQQTVTNVKKTFQSTFGNIVRKVERVSSNVGFGLDLTTLGATARGIKLAPALEKFGNAVTSVGLGVGIASNIKAAKQPIPLSNRDIIDRFAPIGLAYLSTVNPLLGAAAGVVLYASEKSTRAFEIYDRLTQPQLRDPSAHLRAFTRGTRTPMPSAHLQPYIRQPVDSTLVGNAPTTTTPRSSGRSCGGRFCVSSPLNAFSLQTIDRGAAFDPRRRSFAFNPAQ